MTNSTHHVGEHGVLERARREAAAALLVALEGGGRSTAAVAAPVSRKTGDEVYTIPTFPAGPQRFGVNVHFNWAAFQGIAAEARMLGGAFGTSRMDLSWSHVELSKGVFDFVTTGYDGYVAHLLAANPPVRPYFILSYGNVLYDNACAPADKHDGTCAPVTDTGRQAFANFTVAAMQQWRGRGIIFEIWNEPNGGTWLPHSTPPGADFAKLITAVGKARNAAGLHGELLVGPATAGFDLVFIETIAQAGCLAYLDGVSVHPYRPGAPESVLVDYKKLQALIDRYTLPPGGDGGNSFHQHRPRLISGEWGWPSCTFPNGTAIKCSGGGGAGQVLTEQLQAARLVRQRYINDLAGVAVSIWYDWVDDGPSSIQGEDNFGTIRNHQAGVIGGAGTPKPGYLAALASTALLGNCSLVSRLNCSTPGNFALQYHCFGDTTSVYVAWDPTEASSGEASTIVLPLSDAGACFVVQDMYGASACKMPPRCLPTVACAHGTTIALQFTAQPQYLVRELRQKTADDQLRAKTDDDANKAAWKNPKQQPFWLNSHGANRYTEKQCSAMTSHCESNIPSYAYLDNQPPWDQNETLPLLHIQSESANCDGSEPWQEQCQTAAAIAIYHNWRRNGTEARGIRRSAHSSGMYVQAFGALANRCSENTTLECTVQDDCESVSAGFCNTRPGSSVHLEPHGETIGLFVDGANVHGEGKRRGIYLYNSSLFIDEQPVLLRTKRADGSLQMRAIGIGSALMKITSNTTINITSDSAMLLVSGVSPGIPAVGVRLTDGAWDGQQLSLFAGNVGITLDVTAVNLQLASGIGGHGVQLCSEDCCLLSLTLTWLDTVSRWMETSRAPAKCSPGEADSQSIQQTLEGARLRSRLEELRQLESDGLITTEEGAEARRLALGLALKTDDDNELDSIGLTFGIVQSNYPSMKLDENDAPPSKLCAARLDSFCSNNQTHGQWPPNLKQCYHEAAAAHVKVPLVAAFSSR